MPSGYLGLGNGSGCTFHGNDILWACLSDKTSIDVLFGIVDVMILNDRDKIEVLESSQDVMEVLLWSKDMTIVPPLNVELAMLTGVMHVKGLAMKIGGKYASKWHDQVKLALDWNNQVWTQELTLIHYIIPQFEIKPDAN